VNPAAILALISDLYAQVQELARENTALRAQLDDDRAGDVSDG
jgi:cell division protein FtsB